MQDLKVTFIQIDNHWHDVAANLALFGEKISQIEPETDIILLPEMFSTGFTMEVQKMAEKMDGKTVRWMTEQASKNRVLILGSIIIEENGKYFNRLVWMQPNGELDFYDKRHLFRMADEEKYFSMGSKRMIKEWKGWKILPLVCYDLRFPVWCRNTFDKKTGTGDYDALIFVANWPQPRINAWDALLRARAIENLSYCIGLNRIGEDGAHNLYNGHSAAYSPKGDQLFFAEAEERIETISLNYQELAEFRQKFPAYRDADNFGLSL
jgi:predicted amidohydrolase